MNGNSLWQKLPKDDKFRRELWLVVSRLKELQLSYGQSFTTFTPEIDGLKPKDVISKLKLLNNQGVLQYKDVYEDLDNSLSHSEFPSITYQDYPPVISIKLHKLFDSLYAEFELQPVVPEKVTESRLKVTLIRDGLNLYLKTADGERVAMKRLRTDLTPYKLLSYLLAHPNTVILMENLKLEGKGFGNIGNVGERLRKAGFTPTIKKYFLPDNDKDKVRLLNETEMSRTDFEKIKSELSPEVKSE